MNSGAEPPGMSFLDGADGTEAHQPCEAVLNAIDDGIYQLDADERVVAVNDALLETTGYASEELLGEHVSALFDGDGSTLEHGIDRFGADPDGRGELSERSLRTADGNRMPCEVRASPLEVDGTVRGSVGTVRAVAERSEFENGQIEGDEIEGDEVGSGRIEGDEAERVEVESGLQATEQRYQRLVEQNLVGIYLVQDGAIRYVNPKLAEIFGYSPAAMVSETDPLDHVAPEDRDRVAENLRAHVDGDADSMQYTFTGIGSDGERIELETHGSRVEYDGAPAVLGASIDVTERERAEAELRRERTLKDQIVETSPVGIVVVDPDGAIEFANERAEEIYGRSREELADFSHDDPRWDLVDEDGESLEAGDAPFDRVLAREEAIYDQIVGLRRSCGERIWLSVNGAPQWEEAGELERAVFAFEDVTEHVEREAELDETIAELRESEERLQLALEAGEMGTWELDPRTGDSPVRSPQHDRIFGYEEPVDDWNMETFLEHVHPDDRERVERTFEAAFETGNWAFECRIDRADGEQRTIAVEGELYFDEEGEAVRAVGVVQDVTERTERERELERALDLLERMQSIADVGGWEIDPQTRDVFWTEQTFDLLEVDAEEEPPLEAALDMYHEADQPTVEAVVEEALATGDPFDVEVRVRTDGGEIRWLRLQGVPETDDGEVVSFRGAAQDVTEQLERERHLERYETIVESVNDGVYVVDEAGTFQMVNETYAEMFGYAPDELVGTDAARLVPDDVLEGAEALHEAAADGRVEQPSMESELRTADGEWLPVEATLAPLPESDDSDWHRVGVVRDVSERRARERAIEESERRYRALVEHFPNGSVGLFDEDLRYTAVGGQLFDRLDYDPEDRIGETISELHPPDLLEETEPYFQAALDGERHSFDLEYAGRHLHATTLPIADDADEVFAGMIVIQDVTERREYEHRLEESNERLEQFAYAASHDLQEPLRMVSSYLRLLDHRNADDLDDDGREYLEFAVDGADRMRSMIDGLLQYARVDTRGDPFEPVDLDDVLDDVCDDLQVRIEESDAEITVDSLPVVEGDAEQLRQLFQNLLDNAIDYSGDEPPRVTVSAEQREPRSAPERGGSDTEIDGPEWIVSVRDEGIGIDPEDVDSVFEVFESLHSRDEHPGTGIGLALCERIVERHGGDIWVDSTPGEGSTFSVALPAATGEET